MARLPDGRREVYPSRESRPKRRAPDFGPGLNVSVPISFGLPLVVVGIALIAYAYVRQKQVEEAVARAGDRAARLER